MGAAAPVIGLALAAIGTVQSMKIASDAAEENKKIQNQQAAVSAQKRNEERRKLARERRIARAKILQQSENSGTGGSSAEAGAVSNIQTQSAAGRQSIFTSETAEKAITKSRNKLADLNVDSQVAGAVTNLGTSIFGM
jgi:formylmethanofuran dehydrogenase subunit A